MTTNPYATQLGHRDALEVISATPKQLKAFAASLGDSGLGLSLAPGKWTVRQILCHLADCEMVFGYRLRQTLAEDRHTIQPFDQDKWAKPYGGATYSAQEALDLFSAARNWNVKLIREASAAERSKKVSHPERGEMTFDTIVETMAGHDLNHLQQVETIAVRAGKGHSSSVAN